MLCGTATVAKESIDAITGTRFNIKKHLIVLGYLVAISRSAKTCLVMLPSFSTLSVLCGVVVRGFSANDEVFKEVVELIHEGVNEARAPGQLNMMTLFNPMEDRNFVKRL